MPPVSIHSAFVAGALTALSFLPAAISAQAATRTSFGALFGASLASITDTEVGNIDFLGVSSETRRRVGFQIGAYLQQPLSHMVSLQPELHYIQKGAKLGVSVTDIEGGDTEESAEAKLQLTYVEVPLLLRLDFGRGSTVRPFLVAGPSVAFRVACNVNLEYGGASIDAPCDEADDDPTTTDEDPLERFDAGGIIGAGLAGTFGGRTISAHVRYSHGLVSIARESADGRSPRNTGISILFGVGF